MCTRPTGRGHSRQCERRSTRITRLSGHRRHLPRRDEQQAGDSYLLARGCTSTSAASRGRTRSSGIRARPHRRPGSSRHPSRMRSSLRGHRPPTRPGRRVMGPRPRRQHDLEPRLRDPERDDDATGLRKLQGQERGLHVRPAPTSSRIPGTRCRPGRTGPTPSPPVAESEDDRGHARGGDLNVLPSSSRGVLSRRRPRSRCCERRRG